MEIFLNRIVTIQVASLIIKETVQVRLRKSAELLPGVSRKLDPFQLNVPFQFLTFSLGIEMGMG